jgi:TPR repeat protein
MHRRIVSPWNLLVLALCVSIQLPASCGVFDLDGQASRNLEPATPPPGSAVSSGAYYALLIGNNKYRYVGGLETAVNDVDAVAMLLGERYGFKTKVLHDVTRNEILTALNDYRRTLPEDSSLLIYYAGHGYHDPGTNEAYWLPVDAQKDNNQNWISADDITASVRAIASRSIIIISDSCYSGVLTRSRSVPVAIASRERNTFLAQMSQSKSRHVMASGRDEPVADLGARGHSIFANAVLDGLRKMEAEQFTADELFLTFIQPQVAGTSDQVPQYDPIINSGHEYGDFVFARRSTAVVAAGKGSPETPDAIAKKTAEATSNPGSKESEDAVRWLRDSAEAGNLGAQAELGAWYAKGLIVEKDLAEGYKWLRKAADRGHPGAEYNLALLYGKGEGVPQDNRKALELLQKAADQGHQDAQYYLAQSYRMGDLGLQPDAAKSTIWYVKAAEQGQVDAQNNLGAMYHSGIGVSKDDVAAVKWLTKAAEQGDASGEHNLALMYRGGFGVAQDYKMSVEWEKKAAEQGYGPAQNHLGVDYAKGWGVPNDPEEAARWFQKAADQGDPQGEYNLGVAFAQGLGVKQDYVKALAWVRRAADHGNEDAKALLAKLLK